MKSNYIDPRGKGFTIVELLVVIVVIGILASITVISYTGVSQKATAVSMQSDLASAKKQVELYKVIHGSYPTAFNGNNCPSAPELDTNYCIKISGNNTIANYTSTGINFSLKISNPNGTLYQITDSTSPTIASALTCPTGFIVVPGSATYGTSDFCVMKYEAKADANADGIGDTDYTTGYNTYPADIRPISASIKLVSSAAGYPVAKISQTTAIAAASNPSFVAGCTSGCHLITEAEWMTIAQNVISVPSNWSSGIVGTGYIYSGHNDNVPATALVADSNDLNGYANTGQSSPSNQKRTLTLTNGEVIWDFAGNLWEWSSGQMTGGQPDGMSVWAPYEWTAVSGGSFAVNPYPSGTGSGRSSWNSDNGIGMIYGLTSNSLLHGFIRGGTWVHGKEAGVLAMALGDVPSALDRIIGLRVSR